MANFVELSGGTIIPSSALAGGVLEQNAALDGGAIQIAGGGGGGGATLETLNVSYTPSETAISDTQTPSSGYDGFDEVNVTVGAIPSNYVGTGITRRTSSDLSASGATVTAPSGYYASSASKTIPNASELILSVPTVANDGTLSLDLDIVTGGYIASQSTTVTAYDKLTVQSAQTICPSTSDQTIASGKYLTGAQTIKGDANLLAANIKSGVTIFGITGTYDGGGWVEQTISDSGAVTQALDPNVLYHFTGTLTSLTVTLNAPGTGEIAHYHFDFESGSTAPTLNVPVSVTMPDDFSAPEANNHYEVDILNNYGTVVAWAN